MLIYPHHFAFSSNNPTVSVSTHVPSLLDWSTQQTVQQEVAPANLSNASNDDNKLRLVASAPTHDPNVDGYVEGYNYISMEYGDVPALVKPWIPAGGLTLLSGHGGAGKTMLALQICAHVAAGKPIFGLETTQGPTMFVSAEDHCRHISARLRAIYDDLGIVTETEKRRLPLGVYKLRQNPVLFDRNGITKSYENLLEACRLYKPSLLVVDNASLCLRGDMWDKAQVTDFLATLQKGMSPWNGSVLLLAHLSKHSNGSGGHNYSDSVAFHNHSRSRIVLDDLTVSQEKNNNDSMAAPIRLERGPNGLLYRLDVDANDERTQARLKVVLESLADLYAKGNWVSPATNAANNPGKRLGEHPAVSAAKIPSEAVRPLVERLKTMGYLTVETYAGKSKDKTFNRLAVTEEGHDFLAGK